LAINELFHHGDLTLRMNLEGGIWNRGEQLDSLPVSHLELRRLLIAAEFTEV
jgi:hypothetical protein